MKINITSSSGEVSPLEVGADLTVQDLQALAELETRVPQAEMLLVHNMAPLVELTKTVAECGVEEGDVIVVSRVEGGVTLSDPTQVSSVSGLNTLFGPPVSCSPSLPLSPSPPSLKLPHFPPSL